VAYIVLPDSYMFLILSTECVTHTLKL